ncbi:ComEA family DNA-binding protein [Fulvivirga lutimaris]|uniref:ComEA family DNA-binding protein n=1 Tax=Fulvivirga lutimaris TaxID=1819566 RepID=UPI0012BC2A15|nr:helix-hairpin-helix domain-containing protein [Fulvivirga lutimaris]MTI41805.1 helix-hairpin-helix domain-containing protein [Fulvivirga lutimaris]
MNRINHWLRSQLGISKTEANGMIILIPLVFLFIVSPYWYRNYKAQNVELLIEDQLVLDSLVAVWRKSIIIDSSSGDIEPYVVHRYNKFKSKRFESTERADRKPEKKVYKVKIETFDLNSADTINFKQIRGIGSVLSKRIIKYRDLLGGFTNKGQLKEVYGLKDSVILALDSVSTLSVAFTPEQIDINKADEYSLSKHPYISRTLAKAIINYRFQHGPFNQVADLQNIHRLDSLKLQQITPYIKFQEP